ncbi:MAG TPA: DUF1353 domain-containing protein [Bryobacteraceae bacterium]|jgi:hypothetical protein|nr:DUF1353 domain-containing protein [Bryobacteraceae bacterium]
MRKISRRTTDAAPGALQAVGGKTANEKTGGRVAPAEAEKWMESWRSERAPVGALYLGRFADPIYFLTKPITWKPNEGQERYQEVSVPAGFVTDLASIPRVFWTLLRPDGRYAYSAIVHDYLYWFQTRPREESDTILKLGMKDFSIDVVTITAIYDAVRVGGGASWSGNERLRKAGEKRILKRFPDDPRTTWAEWKELPDNFE